MAHIQTARQAVDEFAAVAVPGMAALQELPERRRAYDETRRHRQTRSRHAAQTGSLSARNSGGVIRDFVEPRYQRVFRGCSGAATYHRADPPMRVPVSPNRQSVQRLSHGFPKLQAVSRPSKGAE